MRVGKNVFAVAAPLASVMVGCVFTAPAEGDILVQNNSFESPGNIPQGFASPSADYWTMNGNGTFVNFPPFGLVPAGTGIYSNPTGSNAGHLNGVDQSQAAYIFSNVGNDISQGLVTPGNTNTAAVFEAGHSYTLTVSLADAGSSPPPTDQLLVGLYYVGTNSQRVQVASQIVTAADLNQASMTDFTIPSAVLDVSDPAVGQQINVQFTPLSNGGGEFDIDNVRVVPEPTVLGLLGIGTAGLLARRRRQ